MLFGMFGRYSDLVIEESWLAMMGICNDDVAMDWCHWMGSWKPALLAEGIAIFN